VEAQIVRVHNCYGKGQPEDRFIADTSTKLINRKEVVLKYPNRIRDFCLVSEAAAKISDFATNFDSTPNVDSVEIGTGVGLSLSEAAIEISKILNVDSSLVVIPPFDILDPHQREVAELASHPMGKCEIEFKVGIYRTLKEK
jgi:nucleoside-diphosphate-sugar epimerase